MEDGIVSGEEVIFFMGLYDQNKFRTKFFLFHLMTVLWKNKMKQST